MTRSDLSDVRLRTVECFGAVLLLLIVLAPNLQGQSFSTQTLIAGSNPEDVIAVDLNHDFLPDLVVLHRAAEQIWVYLNAGGGKFSAPSTYFAPPGPISLDAVDVDLDGNVDLIVGSSAQAAFSVYQGNGNGTFLPARDYSVAGWSASLSLVGNHGFVGDPVSTDVLSVSMDQISLAFGRPYDATFVGGSVLYQWSGQGKLTHGIYADFTNDGGNDVLFAQCCGTGTVPKTTLYLVKGTPGVAFQFNAPVKVATLNQVHSLVQGDIRQNGNKGLLATFSGCSGSGCQGVMLLTGLGNGTFQQTMLEVPASNFDVPRSPQLIDYNGDGLNDVAVLVHHRVTTDGSAPHDAVLVWTANRDGTYKPYVEINLGTNGLDSTSTANSMTVADVNGDGKLDLVVVNPMGNSVRVLTNKTTQATTCAARVDGASVVSCRPLDGALVDATDLRVNCAAGSSQVVTGCNAYIDGVLMYRGSGATFDRSFLIPTGEHVVVVRAWDSTGRYFQTIRRMTLMNHYVAICPPGVSETVNFCVPARDGTAMSPVRVLATGSSHNVVTATNIYIDNALAYVGGMFVDKKFTLPNGTHRIVAQSWNRNGAYFMASRTVNVTAQGCPAGPLMSLNVCGPTNGATVSSPVHVEAVANSDHAITGWRVYLNTKSILGSYDKQLSTDLMLPKGTQSLVIKAWDSAGRVVGTVTRTVNVQ